MTPRHPRLRRWAWISAGLLVGFTAISGAMHLPVVQRAMGWVDDNGQVACPFGHGAAGPRAPRELDMSLSAAASRPALGFVLDATTRADLDVWASDHGVTCTPAPRNPRVVTCTAVPAAALASGLDAIDPPRGSSSATTAPSPASRRRATPRRRPRSPTSTARPRPSSRSPLAPPRSPGTRPSRRSTAAPFIRPWSSTSSATTAPPSAPPTWATASCSPSSTPRTCSSDGRPP
jgi:hypothetical protein